MIELDAVHPIITALGWTLVHFLWQGALVALAFGLARSGFRRSTAESRYGLACATLFTMALLPLCTFAMVWSSLPPTGAAVAENLTHADVII